MPTTTVEYQLGFEAGYRYALTPRVRTVAPERKLFAAVTLTIGLGSTAALVASTTHSKWRHAFAAFAVTGLLLSTVLATTRVLNGGPAPWEL